MDDEKSNVEKITKEVTVETTTTGSDGRVLPDVDILVYDEIGLAGYLLLIAIGWLVTLFFLKERQLKTERKSHENTKEKLYNLGMASVKSNTEVGVVLEKLYQIVLSTKLKIPKKENDDTSENGRT